MWAASRSLAMLSLAVLVAAGPLAPAQAASVSVAVKASVLKPLQLISRQNLDFGQIILPTTGGSVTVGISTGGILSCPAPLLCTGTARPAILNVSGTNGRTALIMTTASDLVSGAGDRLRFVPVAPGSVTFPNSGNKGVDFNVGGSIAVSPATPGGNYSGTVQVTVDYQ